MKAPGYQNINNIKLMQQNIGCNILAFSDILEDLTSSVTKVKKDEYSFIGEYSIIDQGKEFIAGYYNSNQGISSSGPHIVFGDHTRIFKYVDFPILLGADGTKLLAAKISDVNMKYLYYFFNTLSLPNDGYSRHFKYLKQVVIPLPNIQYQNKIANILDQAQRLIDKRKEQIALLDDLIQSVFYDMFGDPGLNSKEWECGRISDIIVKTQYGTSTKANENEGEYAVLRMNNITYRGNWDLRALKYIDLDEKDRKKYLVYKGEVLFNRTNSKELVGKTAVYKREEPMAYAGYLVKAIPNNRANGQFIASYMNTKYIKSLLFNMAKNIVGMANINAEEFKSIKVYIPPIELQNHFAEMVENIEKQKELLNKSLAELETNFHSLMQRAFRGELVVE